MSRKKTKPKIIELVKSSYNPTKAELDKDIALDVTGDTVLERMGNLSRAVTRSVKIRWIGRPRSRR